MFAHFRPIFICFLSLALGVWFAELWREGKIIFMIFLLSVLGACIILSFIKPLRRYKFFDYLFKVNKFMFVCAISCIVGFGSFCVVCNNVNNESNPTISSNETYVVIARVRNTPIEYEDYLSMFIDNAILATDEDDINLDGYGMYVKIDKNECPDAVGLRDAKAGDLVTFYARVRSTNVFSDNDVFSFAYKNNIRYMATVTNSAVNIINGEMTALESVRQYIKDTIYKSMGKRYAGLAYALFVGDVSGLDYDIKNNFTITGIAHLLAVSGLNTSLMAMVLVWIFRKCKIKMKWCVGIVALLLSLYCIICDFCPSVLRASLMSVFLLFGQAFGKQSDSINSVSLAGIVLLLVNPMYLFDLSFLLSFASVYGIIFLYPLFYDLLMKMKLGKFVSATLALSIAAQIGTLPLIVNTFGFVSLVSLFVNFLVVPFLEYVYIAMFVSLIIVMIIPIFYGLLWLCQWGLWLVDIVSSWVASWGITTVDVAQIYTTLEVFFFMAMFCFSRFCVLTKKNKIILHTTLMAIGALLIIANYTIFPLL